MDLKRKEIEPLHDPFRYDKSDDLIDRLVEDWLEMDAELTRLKSNHAAEADANTVLDVVAAPVDLKCCGNCLYEDTLNCPHYRTTYGINSSTVCDKWQYDEAIKAKRWLW